MSNNELNDFINEAYTTAQDAHDLELFAHGDNEIFNTDNLQDLEAVTI